MNYEELIMTAIEAREDSYCPYSEYAVGAALLAKNGDIIKGCNIENASYGVTNCAERTAFFKAVSGGYMEFSAIAIAGGSVNNARLDMAYPCGVCRQVMREFTNPKEFKIIVARAIDDYEEYTLEELLPHSFGPENLD